MSGFLHLVVSWLASHAWVTEWLMLVLSFPVLFKKSGNPISAFKKIQNARPAPALASHSFLLKKAKISSTEFQKAYNVFISHTFKPPFLETV